MTSISICDKVREESYPVASTLHTRDLFNQQLQSAGVCSTSSTVDASKVKLIIRIDCSTFGCGSNSVIVPMSYLSCKTHRA
jgi:hypothetical protein